MDFSNSVYKKRLASSLFLTRRYIYFKSFLFHFHSIGHNSAWTNQHQFTIGIFGG